MIFGINEFSTSGSSVVSFATVPTSGTGGVFALRNPDNSEMDSFFSYTNGDTHHIDLVGDYSDQTIDAYVDGVLEVSDSPMRNGKSSNTLSETFLFVNGETGTSNSVAIDNLTVSVPEPTSLGILSIGAMAMLRRKRAR